ncbi:hypothetical protein JCM19241_5964 [Vibrio ishigakensis]|uniref:Uncharacterized protein n=1 Tax=Vibrio ishigakensis TaxID=1481914 RepID=A0A0B8QQ19_9VIBR|nr:hypothetical protein JCM19241_5964 [Vibrio ishigakensis]
MTSPVVAEGITTQTDGAVLVGLYETWNGNFDPSLNTSFTIMAHTGGANISCFANGTDLGDYGSYEEGDTLSVEYIGSTVYYKHNGSVVETFNAGAGKQLALYTSGFQQNNEIDGIRQFSGNDVPILTWTQDCSVGSYGSGEGKFTSNISGIVDIEIQGYDIEGGVTCRIGNAEISGMNNPVDATNEWYIMRNVPVFAGENTVYAYSTTSDGGNFNAIRVINKAQSIPFAGMNGSDLDPNYAGYRFWSGSTIPSQANFSVDSGGNLYAQNAVVEGTVNATAGDFTGHIYVGSTGGKICELRGHQTVDTDAAILIGHTKTSDANWTGSWRYNGHFTLRNTSGVEMVDLNPVTEQYYMHGDVMSNLFASKLKTSTSRDINATRVNNGRTEASETIISGTVQQDARTPRRFLFPSFVLDDVYMRAAATDSQTCTYTLQVIYTLNGSSTVTLLSETYENRYVDPEDVTERTPRPVTVPPYMKDVPIGSGSSSWSVQVKCVVDKASGTTNTMFASHRGQALLLQVGRETDQIA